MNATHLPFFDLLKHRTLKTKNCALDPETEIGHLQEILLEEKLRIFRISQVQSELIKVSEKNFICLWGNFAFEAVRNQPNENL